MPHRKLLRPESNRIHQRGPRHLRSSSFPNRLSRSPGHFIKIYRRRLHHGDLNKNFYVNETGVETERGGGLYARPYGSRVAENIRSQRVRVFWFLVHRADLSDGIRSVARMVFAWSTTQSTLSLNLGVYSLHRAQEGLFTTFFPDSPPSLHVYASVRTRRRQSDSRSTIQKPRRRCREGAVPISMMKRYQGSILRATVWRA